MVEPMLTVFYDDESTEEIPYSTAPTEYLQALVEGRGISHPNNPPYFDLPFRHWWAGVILAQRKKAQD